jgi:hypothetical protein
MPEGGRARGLEWAAVAALLLFHALLAYAGIRVHSVTFDERTHLPAGMAAAATGEIVLNRQHPPLVKLLAGAAANTAGPSLPLEGEAYRLGREWEFGDAVLFKAGNDPAELLRRGRLPVLLLSLLGGFFVYRWSRDLFGAGGGLLSLALWSFSPSVLGHDGWVAMDAPLAALGVAALYFTWRAVLFSEGTDRKLQVARFAPGTAELQLGSGTEGKEPSWSSAVPGGGLGGLFPKLTGPVLAGLFLGLALAAKFSALVFAAAILPLCFYRASPKEALLRRLLPLGAAAAVTLWIAYLLPRDPLFYLRDLQLLYRDVKPDYLFYLAGELARRFPHYFLATFALKSTPVELLLAPLAALGVWLSSRRRELLAFVAFPALLFFVATSALATNQGHRYILPCYPLLFVLAGALPALLAPRLRRAGLLLGLLAGAQCFEAIWHQPDHLSYFNAFAGGPRRGPFWLDDSNVDWGQDLARLPSWLAERQVGHVRAAFLGNVDPAFYGVSWEPVQTTDLRDAPRPGAYLISGHVLARLLVKADQEGWHSDWLRRYEPAGVLGGSFFLFVFPEQLPEEQVR